MALTTREIQEKVKNVTQLYHIIAKEYYLPDLSSKAITKDYLLKYILKDCPIFTMKRVDVVHHHFRFRKYTSAELLEHLENMLKAKGKKPAGLSFHTLPDQQWLLNTILHVDPNDPLRLIKTQREEEVKAEIEVNEE